MSASKKIDERADQIVAEVSQKLIADYRLKVQHQIRIMADAAWITGLEIKADVLEKLADEFCNGGKFDL